jgi:hypothetical protein
MKHISKALLEAQKEMGNALKESKNPFFKSSYADLNSIREACMPSLNKHGIVVLQPTAFIDGKNFIKTILLHESGESMESLTEIVYSKQNDAQSQGSGITYARRYGLQSFVNVGAEDDDGNKASQSKKEEPPKQKAHLLATKIDDVNKALQEGKTTMDFLLANYTISNEVMNLLIIPKK